jgi:hypothetical protein
MGAPIVKYVINLGGSLTSCFPHAKVKSSGNFFSVR